MKLTPWYPGHVKPVRVGVYERKYRNINDNSVYSRWNGEKWFCGSFHVHFAEEDMEPSSYQSLPWRGIAKEPK